MGNKVDILGVKVNNVSFSQAVDKLKAAMEKEGTTTLYTPNSEIVMAAQNDRELMDLLNSGSLVIADGIGLIYASRINKNPLPERVTGFDISLALIKYINEKGYTIYILGSSPENVEEAVKRITDDYPNINIGGYHHGYFSPEEEETIISNINKANPHFLMVGFGAPKQEKWIHRNKGKLNARVIGGIGGTIDILSGRVKRAPDMFCKLGLEWFYRLVKQPSRYKRMMALPKFMIKVLRTRK